MSRFRTIALILSVFVLGWQAACDKSPTQASRIPPPPPPPTQSPTQVTLQSIRVDGPTSVPPGIKAQYAAIGQMSDGTTQDLTATTTWRSSDDAVLSISATGEATGGKNGEVVLAAENSDKRASLQVLVLTPGTHRLTGRVSDGGIPVSGATVDVLDGSRAIMSTRTDADGIYRLYGLVGDVELRVRADGYPDQVRGTPVTDDTTIDFTLPASANVTGAYTLTVTADAKSCPLTARNALPPEWRVRTYDAIVSQNGSQLSVKLSGGALTYGSFSGTQNGTTATFEIHGITTDPYYHYYSYFDRSLDLVEQLPANQYLIISGTATTSKVASGLSGQLVGVMGVVGSLSGYPNLSPSCWGSQTFDFSKR